MNAVDFCFWLQGFFEISEDNNLSPRQLEVIKAHLSLVFVHEIDPMREAETSATKQQLDVAHAGKPVLEAPSYNEPPFRPKQPGGFGNDLKMRC